MVPGSTLMYGSSFTMLIFKPRASRMAPREADAMPLPSEETTPPVTKTNRVMIGSPPLNGFPARSDIRHARSRAKKELLKFDGSSGYQIAPPPTIGACASPTIGASAQHRRIVPGAPEAGLARGHAPARILPEVADGDRAPRPRTAWAAHRASTAARLATGTGAGQFAFSRGGLASSTSPPRRCRTLNVGGNRPASKPPICEIHRSRPEAGPELQASIREQPSIRAAHPARAAPPA